MAVRQKVEKWFAQHSDEVIGWRRHLHQHPELSRAEHSTTAFIAETLRSYGLEPHFFPETGLMVDIGPADAPCVAFRGDIDALPLTEETGLPYASAVSGRMHACGHDVHTTIVLALACALSECADELPCRVRIIAQPAEEVMTGGAPDVIAAGGLDGVNRIFALHVEPKIRVGQVGLKVGPITSASDVLRITVKGDGGHSSRPHLTSDLVYALGALTTQLPSLLSRRLDPRTATVLVFGSVHCGAAANAIATQGSLLGTIRTADRATWRTLEPLMRELIEQVLAPTGVRHEVRYTRGVPPVFNDDASTAMMAQAVRKIDPTALLDAPQSSGGEDFAWYLENVPGSMARLGCWPGHGPKHDLHCSDIVVDERCIGVGLRLFSGVIDEYEPVAGEGPGELTHY